MNEVKPFSQVFSPRGVRFSFLCNLSPARSLGRETSPLSNIKTAAAEEAVRRPPLRGPGQGQPGGGGRDSAGSADRRLKPGPQLQGPSAWAEQQPETCLPSPTAGEPPSRGPHPPSCPGSDVRPLDRAPAPPLQAASAARGPRLRGGSRSRCGTRRLRQAEEAARHFTGLPPAARRQGEARPGGARGCGRGTPAPRSARPRPLRGPHPLPRGIAGHPASRSCPSPPEPANRPRLPRPHLPESLTGVRLSL